MEKKSQNLTLEKIKETFKDTDLNKQEGKKKSPQTANNANNSDAANKSLDEIML